MTDKPIRIISVLDGGGLRGYYTVWLLEKLFEEAGCDLIKESSLVGGTSTGGIITISKAVGKTGNDELSNLYAGTAAKNIFVDSYLKIIENIIENGEAYISDQLEDYAIKVLVGPSGVIENNQNFFVTACSPKNGNKDDVALDILSNYKPVDNDRKSFIVDSQRFIVGSGDDKNQLSTIEAIRATSDIPGAFKLITKDDVTFYDEARNQFPNDRIIILSFGTAETTDTDGITNDQLKDINIQSNLELEQILTPHDEATKTLLQSGDPAQNVKQFLDNLKICLKLVKNSPSSHTLYENFMKFLKDSKTPDKNVLVFRFESKLEKQVGFSDTSKESLTALMNGAIDLSNSEQFKKTAKLLRQVITNNNGGKEPSYISETICPP
ncbi:hypothetical protein ACTFIT_001442 [Dictyostelium discoideum]